MRFSDSFGHLAIIKNIHSKGIRTTARHGVSGYPIMFHWLWSWAPPTLMRRLEPLNAAICDSFHVSLIFVIAFKLAPALQLNLQLAPWFALCLALYPGWITQVVGPRAYSFNERVFGELSFTLVMAGWLLFANGEGWAFYAISIFGGVVIFLSSKFSIQAVCIFSVLLFVILGSPAFLLFPVFCYLFSLFFPVFPVTKNLKGQLIHLLGYVEILPKMWAGSRNDFSNRYPEKRFGQLITVLDMCYRHNGIAVGLYQHFPAFLLVYVFSDSADGLTQILRIFVGVGMVTWLMTSLGVFKVLGEAERYLTHAILPIALLAWSWFSQPGNAEFLPLVGGLFIFWALVQQAYVYVLARREMNRFDAGSYAEMLNFLEDNKGGRVATAGSLSFVWRTSLDLENPHFMFDERILDTFSYDDVFEEYPFPRREALEMLGTDLLLVEKGQLDKVRRSKPEYLSDILADAPEFQNKSFAVYDAKGPEESAA